MQYRSEVDGLRALAVIPVIVYHTNLGWLTGGYAGVDVFFVISGYLIASIIFAEKAAGDFSLVRFYERRARRILPALFLVVLACIPFAMMWMTKVQLEEFFESVAAVPLFVSNVLFWQRTGYFGVGAETKPLLHTWSLGVEEQFYVLFPLLTMAMWKLRRRYFAFMLLAIAAISLAFSEYAARFSPTANFYLLPSRIWELALGVLLALAAQTQPIHRRVSVVMAEILAGIGLVAVLVSFFLLDQATPFPGLYALLPAGGTGLILAFGHGGTIVGRFLGLPALVGIGLISYSAYLWHQPLFAFARLRSLDEPGVLLYGALSLAALGLAYVSWRLVERPFRDRRRIGMKGIFRGAVLASIAIVAMGVAGRFSGVAEIPARFGFSAEELAAIDPPNGNEAVRDCRWEKPIAVFGRIRTCRFGDVASSKTIFLFGDSHAESLYSALAEKFRQRGIAGVLIRNSHCPAIPGVYEQNRSTMAYHETCLKAHRAAVDHMRQTGQGIIVAMRWTFQLYPVPGFIEQLDFDNGEGGVGEENPRQYYAFENGRFVKDAGAKSAAIGKLAASLLDTGLPIFLLYPVPEIGWRVADRNFKHLFRGEKIPITISTDFSRFQTRQRFVLEQLDAIAPRANLHRIRPSALLCNTYLPDRCVAQIDSRPLYTDDDHLSNAGAAIIADEVLGKLQ